MADNKEFFDGESVITPFREHPLRAEILKKIESGEITIGCPLPSDFVWDSSAKEQFLSAIKEVQKIRESSQNHL